METIFRAILQLGWNEIFTLESGFVKSVTGRKGCITMETTFPEIKLYPARIWKIFPRSAQPQTVRELRKIYSHSLETSPIVFFPPHSLFDEFIKTFVSFHVSQSKSCKKCHRKVWLWYLFYVSHTYTYQRGEGVSERGKKGFTRNVISLKYKNRIPLPTGTPLLKGNIRKLLWLNPRPFYLII